MVRRAISKKKAKEIEKERQAFVYGDAERGIKGCIANGIDEKTAQAIYDEIYDFANYAFNKAHAVSYAVVAYQTAYFKCHYTKEYMAALLTSVLDNSDKVAGYIGECRDCGIALLPPDVNRSSDRLPWSRTAYGSAWWPSRTSGGALSSRWSGSGSRAAALRLCRISVTGCTTAAT